MADRTKTPKDKIKEERKAKIIENPKTTMLVRGSTQYSQILKDFMVYIKKLKFPYVVQLNKVNFPFDLNCIDMNLTFFSTSKQRMNQICHLLRQKHINLWNISANQMMHLCSFSQHIQKNDHTI